MARDDIDDGDGGGRGRGSVGDGVERASTDEAADDEAGDEEQGQAPEHEVERRVEVHVPLPHPQHGHRSSGLALEPAGGGEASTDGRSWSRTDERASEDAADEKGRKKEEKERWNQRAASVVAAGSRCGLASPRLDCGGWIVSAHSAGRRRKKRGFFDEQQRRRRDEKSIDRSWARGRPIDRSPQAGQPPGWWPSPSPSVRGAELARIRPDMDCSRGELKPAWSAECAVRFRLPRRATGGEWGEEEMGWIGSPPKRKKGKGAGRGGKGETFPPFPRGLLLPRSSSLPTTRCCWPLLACSSLR